MEDILARYLDGDLTDAEASEFLRQSKQDPKLARVLRDYETIVNSAEALPRHPAPAGLADKVMAAVQHSDQRSSHSRSLSAGWAWLAAAATLVLGLGIGFLGGRSQVSDTRVSADARPRRRVHGRIPTLILNYSTDAEWSRQRKLLDPFLLSLAGLAHHPRGE